MYKPLCSTDGGKEFVIRFHSRPTPPSQLSASGTGVRQSKSKGKGFFGRLRKSSAASIDAPGSGGDASGDDDEGSVAEGSQAGSDAGSTRSEDLLGAKDLVLQAEDAQVSKPPCFMIHLYSRPLIVNIPSH